MPFASELRSERTCPRLSKGPLRIDSRVDFDKISHVLRVPSAKQ